MPRSRLIVAGDSHVHAIRDALRLQKPHSPGISVEALRIKSEKGTKKGLGDISFADLLTKVAELERTDTIAVALRGNQYNSIGLMQHPESFDLVLPEVDKATVPGASIIPVGMFRRYFASSLRSGYGKHLLEVRAATSASVFCLETPPPKDDASHILRNAESFFRKHGIMDIGVTAASVRLKLWTLQQQALAEFCSQHDIGYVSCPANSRDEHGFLRREYYADDATHANEAYGALVLNRLTLMASAKSADSTNRV